MDVPYLSLKHQLSLISSGLPFNRRKAGNAEQCDQGNQGDPDQCVGGGVWARPLLQTCNSHFAVLKNIGLYWQTMPGMLQFWIIFIAMKFIS